MASPTDRAPGLPKGATGSLVRVEKAIDPLPGRLLVVFKKVGTGRVFHSCVGPSEKLQRRLLESPKLFLAYSVPTDPNLRHYFSKEFDSHDQAHDFELHFKLAYEITNPRQVVELADTDPLGRVEDEIHSLVVLASKRIPWSRIELEEVDLFDLLFGTSFENGARETNFEQLKGLGRALGLEIHQVLVWRQLSEEDSDPARSEARATRLERILGARKQVEEHVDDVKHTRARRQNRFDWETQIQGSVADGITESIQAGFEGITDLHAIPEAVDTVRQIGQALTPSTSDSFMPLSQRERLPGDRIEGSASGEIRTDPGTTSVGGRPMDDFMARITRLLEQLPMDEEDRRLVQGAAFSLVGAALRDGADGSEPAEKETALIQRVLTQHLDLLDAEQVKLLRTLLDRESLVERLR